MTEVVPMKKLLLASIVTLLVAPAAAADLGRPTYKAPSPAPVFNWTGCYVGGHAGGLWSSKYWYNHQAGTATLGRSDGGHDANGFVGGAQAGCDYQFAGGFVIGVAGDYAWSNADGSNRRILFAGSNHSKIDSLASVTGRLGFAADRLLGYLKGGVAWERDDLYFTNAVEITTGTASAIRTGWTLGIGGEYAFTNFLSGFVEYSYYDFGNRDTSFAVTPAGTFVYGIDEAKSVVKGGINIRFGGVGPVVARY
ncbi:MAG: porin family protein [Hyphomicrobiales bacterium]|nr:porin family protein [Hyphomicrobiales bacterium]